MPLRTDMHKTISLFALIYTNLYYDVEGECSYAWTEESCPVEPRFPWLSNISDRYAKHLSVAVCHC